jgi:phosphate transport system substrate-binding protein
MLKHRFAILLLTSVAGAAAAAPAPIRIEGGMVVVRSLVVPHRTAVETHTGLALDVRATTSTQGLIALSRGECDLTAIAIPLDLMIADARAAGADLREDDFVTHVVQEDRLVFIVHPSSPLVALNAEQIEGIYAGRITHWKQVGGGDAPIAVFTDKVESGTSSLLRSRVLKGAAFRSDITALSNLKFVADNVAVNQRSIGAVSSAFVVEGAVKVLKTEPITRPLGFVTRGAPSEQMRRVIEAYRAVAR